MYSLLKYFLLIIIIFMAIQTWGDLMKNQIDPETIEQAVARIVAEHNDDNQSHVAIGQSLEAHKASEIIDHPAQSVVFDKKPFNEYDELRSDLGTKNFSIEDGVAIYNNDNMLAFSMFAQTLFYAVGYQAHPYGINYPTSDLVYQFRLQLNGYQSADGESMLVFCNDVYDDAQRIAIEKDGTSFYFRIYVASVVVAEVLLTPSANPGKYYRLFYDSVNEKIIFYQGTTALLTYPTANWKDFVFTSIQMYASRTTNTNISMTLDQWKSTYSVDVDN
jgi:hypothetical protein